MTYSVSERRQEAWDPADKTPGSRDRKRVSILAAARKVFLSQGFQGASMEQVAAVAGASKVTIYSKFGSKQELFRAIVAEICEEILAIEIAMPETMLSVREGLTELAVNYAKVLYDPDVLALVRLAMSENQAPIDLGQLYYSAGPLRARRGLVQLFSALSEAGKLRVSDPDLAADQFLALLQPQRYYVLLDPSARPPDEEISRVASQGVDVFFSYYG